MLLLASEGLAQSQQDAVPNKFSEGEEFSHGGTLTVWVPNNQVRGRMDDPTARVINAVGDSNSASSRKISLTLIWTSKYWIGMSLCAHSIIPNRIRLIRTWRLWTTIGNFVRS